MTLREIREKAKLSIEEAAKRLGIAYDYLVMFFIMSYLFM